MKNFRSVLLCAAAVVAGCGQSPSFQDSSGPSPAPVAGSGADASAASGSSDKSSGGGVIGNSGGTASTAPSKQSAAPSASSPSISSNNAASNSNSQSSAPAAAPQPKAPVTTSVPAVPAVPAAPVVVIPPACDPNAGATQAQVKTASITAQKITIVYKIFRTTCQGVILPLTADQILFDIDALVNGFLPISYSIVADASTPNSAPQVGPMNDIVGSDLFGDQGSNYAHWETNQKISVTSPNQMIELTLSTNFVKSNHADGMYTYLAFGSAAPVKVVVPLQ